MTYSRCKNVLVMLCFLSLLSACSAKTSPSDDESQANNQNGNVNNSSDDQSSGTADAQGEGDGDVIDVTQWPVFKSTIYKFEVQYPTGWLVNKKSEELFGFSPKPVVETDEISVEGVGAFTVEIRKNPENFSIDEFYKQNPNLHFVDSAESQENFMLGGYEAKKYTNLPGMSMYTLVSVKANSMMVELTNNAFGETYENMFEAWFKTLQF